MTSQLSKKQEEINELLKGLNPKQREASTRMDGKYLVLASAGSGKTRVLATRVAYLLQMNIKPWEIVAISFTKKASNELSERIAALVGPVALDVNSGTFHSLCMRILLQNQGALNMQNLTVLDEHEARKIIDDISAGYGFLKDSTDEIHSIIERWGNKGYFPENVANDPDVPQDYINIFSDYTAFKRNVGYIDFNDILTLTSYLFTTRPDILEKYSKKYKYIIIDESQDLNDIQYKIVQQLSSYHHNYMYIGDDFQSIYGFRGSNVQNIMSIRNNDTDVETILLEQNYRSSQTIVNASNGFIFQNKQRLEKVSFTQNDPGAPIFVYSADDEVREAEYVVEIIQGLLKNKPNDYSLEDFAVLYRSNYLSQNVEFALSASGLPYEIPGGKTFYDREEIKSLVCYLRALDNPMDDLAVEYTLNRPKRGIGDTTISRLKVHAAGAQVPVSVVLPNVEDVAKINKPTKEKIKNYAQFIEEGIRLLQTAESVTPILKYVISATNFMGQYDIDKTKDLERIQNIQELWNVAAQFDAREKEPLTDGQTILTQFLTETALYTPATDEEEMGKITLSTIHGSKGLEYKVVFVIGMQDGTFPSNMSRTSEEEYEEERRLMYVAITRAKELLFLSYNKKRYFYGRIEKGIKSPFLDEIPQQFIRYLGSSK